MKSTTNVFLEGLRTDLHPLSTGQQYLTDALNATMITYNGNEMMLQNDMGNTLIQDSATGNIMGLNPGFIPVGMKEHGGIMYITSVNKDGYGEIGTIPSPIIRDLYKDKVSLSIGKNIPIDSGDPIQITNKLYPADKFITNLQMSIDPSTLKGIKHTKISELAGNNNDPCDIILERQVFNGFGHNDSIKTLPIYSPVISYSSDSEDEIKLTDLANPVTVRKKGIYNLNLYSFFEQGKSTVANLNLLSAQVYGDDGDKTSLFWFLHTDSPTSVFPKDLLNATLNKDLKQVPVSNKPGKLAVKLIPETITDFGMLPRALEPYNTPITYKTTEEQFYTYFPGFYYTSDSGLYVEKLTARVIDENTNLSVDLEYPYGKEILFDRYDLNNLSYTKASDNYKDPFFNGGLKLWDISNDGFGLPHARSNKGSNTYILSPIAGLFNHEKTSFKSSTQGKNESAHSGVFRAVLGENYNRWYRLEVDYEDQYGGNKGTFTTRFNPYINDVFGTNLSVGGVEYADSITMGREYTFKSKQETLYPDSPADWINYSMLQQLCIHATNFYYFPQIYLRRHGDNRFYSDPVTFYRKKANESDVYDGSEGTITYAYKGGKISNDANYAYLYLTLTYTDSVSIPSNSFGVKECTLGFGYENDDPNSKEFKKTNALDTFGENKLQLLIKSDTELDFIKTNIVSNLTNDHFTQLAFLFNGKNTQFSTDGLNGEYTSDSVMYLTMNESTSGRYVDTIPTPRKLSSDVSNSLTFTVDEDNCKLLSDGTYKAVVNVKNWYDGNFYRLTYGFHKDGGDENVFDDAKDYYYWTIGQEGCDNDILDNFRVRADVLYPSSVEVTRKYNQVSPSYKITPYFCLTGINNGEPVHVQRFGKTNDIDMVYQHNFELDNGKAKNFIQEASSNPDMFAAPCSYNNELNQFGCYLGPFSTSLQLKDSGIYVLNIQRCPGVGNWTATLTDPLVNLKIQFNDDPEYSYPKKEGTKISENWSITALDTNNYKYKTSHGETSNMRIYVPIVLIVREASTVKINISAETGWTFNRQSIGLYKINDVEGGDILQDLKDLEEQVYLYHDYMKIVSEMAENHDTGKVKQYSFMLKYGVFFKEAFVFVDGLYKDNNVNSITIGEKTYQPYPYIPSDSSILPVLLGADNNYYWNTYYMPEEVLTSDGCEFIFSNAGGLSHIIDKFKSVTSGKLRQLINT